MALDYRLAYDSNLSAAIAVYGERHRPVKASVYDACSICDARGIKHTKHERLNHQTDSYISGIYADHFPDELKDVLREQAHKIGYCVDVAGDWWKRSGRRMHTFYPLARAYRELPDGRVSYY